MPFASFPLSQREDGRRGWSQSLIGLMIAIVLAGVPVVLPGCTAKQHVATGVIGGNTLTTTVDSELAAHFLGPQATLPSDIKDLIHTIVSRYDAKPLDRGRLRELAAETSVDFAAIYFCRRVLAQSDNQRLQQAFQHELHQFRAGTPRSSDFDANQASYRILFVPGFHYRSHRHTGADLAAPRAYLHQFGFDTALIETLEDGTVEENAEIIAKTIREEVTAGRPIIVVSTSKGGPETALALGRFLDEKELYKVKAWVSVGGILRGTYLADHATTWWKWWLVKLVFLANGIDSRSLPGLTVRANWDRFASLTLPKHLYMLQYIAVPLSGQVSQDVMDRYRELSAYGPNDGLTLLADELVPNGHVILEPGLDHFYRDQDIRIKALALAILVMREVRMPEPTER